MSDDIIPESSDSRDATPGLDVLSTNFQMPGDSRISNELPVLLSKFTLYETKDKFVIVGSNSRETRFRILELTLQDPEGSQDFEVREHEGGVLTRTQVNAVLVSLPEVRKRMTAWGLLGCIRFTGPYYLCLVTKCSVVALLGGHFILHVDETRLVPVVPTGAYRQPDRRSAEARLAGVFHDLDLSKTFYFSPSYDLTNTLQTNLASEQTQRRVARHQMFVWNSHLLSPLLERFDATMDWCLALVHGFIDQAKISVFGNDVYITLIARRSHHFAGARFFKRGTNNQGYVANEVETEQIVSNQLTTSFHDGRSSGRFASPRYTAYVQHRGSIPLSWSQLAQNMSYKPPIRIDSVDPYYATAAMHFDRLFQRYGTPVRVLNLVKTRERLPRESLLGREFETGITYLNQFLPEDKKIHYTAWDMSRAAKTKGRSSEVIDYLEHYAAETLDATSIFHNGNSVQEGVCRTNCIDCLDRTNAAQNVIAKYALGRQLHAMGILSSPHVDYDTDVMDLLTEMYHDHGDTLALQYGGSNLVNTVETYRKINQWTSHSRDLIESIRRFYTNSFVDAQRQDAINVFLGNYQYRGRGTAHLWDLATDYYLHNATNHHSNSLPRRSYRFWYTPINLRDFSARLDAQSQASASAPSSLPAYQLQLEHHWARLYRPRTLTTLASLFLMKMNSTDRYVREPASPFEVHVHKSRKRQKKKDAYKASDTPIPPAPPSPIPGEPPLIPTHLLESTDPNTIVYERVLHMTEPMTPPTEEYEAYIRESADPNTTSEYTVPSAEWLSQPLNELSDADYELYAAS